MTQLFKNDTVIQIHAFTVQICCNDLAEGFFQRHAHTFLQISGIRTLVAVAALATESNIHNLLKYT